MEKNRSILNQDESTEYAHNLLSALNSNDDEYNIKANNETI